ncbi:hypothetical protein pb186bvf_014423 [Paramecium bursaria]
MQQLFTSLGIVKTQYYQLLISIFQSSKQQCSIWIAFRCIYVIVLDIRILILYFKTTKQIIPFEKLQIMNQNGWKK